MLRHSLHELEREIRASELRVVEHDQRLAARLHALRTTASTAIASKLLAGGALVAAGWLLRRPGRGAASAAARAHRHRLAAWLFRVQRWLPIVLPLAAPLLNRKVAMLLSRFGLPVPARDVPPLRTVPALDLQAFSGAWFEIARLPRQREAPGRRNASVHYSVDEQGLALVERWADKDGKPQERRGRVRGTSEQRSGELEVSFAPPWLQWWPGAWHDHWVLYADKDYTCALIGNPERDALVLLAREPTMPDDALQALFTLSERLGFDSARLSRVPHA